MSQYVQPGQLASFGANQLALNRIPLAEQNAACVAASTTMDAYFRGRYNMPFLTFDTDVSMRAAHIAIWLLLSSRGRNPEAGYDDQIDERYKEAIRWCEMVQRQAIHPNVTTAATASPSFSFPAVRTSRPRGWTGRR